MGKINEFLTQIDNILWGDWMLFVLLGIGILYTVISGFVQVRHFPYIIRKTLFDPIKLNQKSSTEKGTVTSFQALCTALASCVGGGNIVGVCTAILAGGMGAIFWMWVAAFVGMATKYGEIILGIKYREKNEKGDYISGPFYYIEKGLNMKSLAILCAFFMVVQIIGGNFIQSNIVSGVVKDSFGVPTYITGIILVAFIFTISVGGLKRLAHMAQKITPIMALVYLLCGLIIILINIEKVPGVFMDIFQGAFGLRAVAGGTLGSMMIAMQKGIARGLYSNEAGEGSASVLHAAANVKHPVDQGITGVTEVFIDTFVICTVTGLIIGVTGAANSSFEGNVLMINAVASVWEPLRYLISISLILFCVTSLTCQWYFGFTGLNYIWGFNVADKFKYVFPFFCMIGAVLKIDLVWTIQDIALALLTIPNIVALIYLYPQVKELTKEYFFSDDYINSLEK